MFGTGWAQQTVTCTPEALETADPFFCQLGQPGCSQCNSFGNVDDSFDISSGVAATCSEAEDIYCPLINCCEPCAEPSQAYFQCIILESFMLIGIVEPGCVMDCSRFPFGVPEEPAPSPTSPPPTEAALTDSIITEAPTPDVGTGLGDLFDDLGDAVGEDLGDTFEDVFEDVFEDILGDLGVDLGDGDLGDVFGDFGDDPDEFDAEATQECLDRAAKFEECAENKCQRTALRCSDKDALPFGADFNDLCGFVEPAVCLIEECCKPCVDEYISAFTCEFENAGLATDCKFNCRGKEIDGSAAKGVPALTLLIFASLLGMVLLV